MCVYFMCITSFLCGFKDSTTSAATYSIPICTNPVFSTKIDTQEVILKICKFINSYN